MLGNIVAVPSLKDTWSSIFAFATDLLGAFRSVESDEARGDEDLVRAMQHGDDRAFELLYERYFQKIYSFTVRRVGHAQTAEDLVSDVFMKAFTHRMSFVWKTSFSAWIYRIATNRITDHHRTKKPADEFDETKHDLPSTVPRPQDEIDNELLGKKLEGMLELLPERDRIAVTMKFYGECDNGEIAKALNVTAGNVGVILHRALKRCATYE